MNKNIYKILIIDDSVEDRVMLRYLLRKDSKNEYAVVEQELGETGLKTCLEIQPDCVLLDYHLPDTDGLTVIKQLNPDPLDPAFPVILLTGAGSEELAVAAIKNGAQDYLVKGRIAPEELSLAIANAIELAALRRTKKRAADSLAESEARLNSILQNTDSVIYLIDEENRFVHVNRHFEKMFGLKADELRGKSIYDFFPKEFADSYRDNNRRVMESGQSLETEETAPQPDGVHTYLSIKAPHFDAHGVPRGVVGISTDITARKKVEEQLRLYEKAVVNSTDAVLITEAEPIDLPGPRILYVNPAFTEMTGYTPEEIIGQTPRILQGPKTDRAQLDKIRNALRKWEPVRVELTNYGKNGKEFEVEFAITPVADENGWFTHWVSVQRDVTERKKAESQFAALNERNRDILESIKDPFFALNRQWQFTFMNRQGEELVFKKPGDLIGKSIWDEFPGLLGSDFEPIYRRAMDEGVSGSVTDFYPDHNRWYEINVYPAQNGVSVYFRNLSDRISAENALRESEEKMRMVLNASKVGIWIVDFASANVYWSPENYAVYGVDRFDGALETFKKFVHPDDAERVWKEFQESVATKSLYDIEFRIVTPTGETRWLGNQGHGEYDADGAPRRFLGTAFDITDRKRRELNLAFLADLSKHFAPLLSAEQIMEAVSTHLAAYLNLSRCLFVEINQIEDTATVFSGYQAPGLPDLRGTYFRPDFYGPEELAKISNGETVCICDVSAPPRAPEAAARFRANGVGAIVTVPYVNDGRWKFVLSAQHSEPYQWRKDEIELLQELSTHINVRLERARAENKLRESEARLAISTTAARLGVFEWRIPEDTAMWEDDRIYEIYGLSLNDAPVGKKDFFKNYLHPEDAESFEAKLNEAFETGDFRQAVCRIIRTDGETRWVEFNGRVQFAEDDTPLSLTGVVADITERKLSEQALSESEERFRALFNSIDEGFCLIELIANDRDEPVDYRFIQINPAFERLTGLQNAVGRTARELVPDVEDFWIETYARVASTGEAARFESKSEAMNRWFDVHASPVGDAASRRVAVVFNNVTERKRAEEDLRETAEFNRTVLESSQDCVKLLDVEGRLQYMNTNGQGLMEIENFEHLKDKFWWDLWEKDSECDIRASVETALSGETARFQAYCPTAKGTPKWWDVIVSPVRGASGEIIRLLSVSRDISESKRYEREREKMLALEKDLRREAEAANTAKDQFLAVLSHELRTPLNAIYGWTQILQVSKYDEKTVGSGIEIISRNVRLQNALIEDLLDVSRIISGKMQIESENMSLIATIQDCLDTARPAAENRNIAIECDFAPHSFEMFGDKNRLQQVIGNLLTNAIKFTPENGSIKLRLEQIGGTARLTVKDSGIGIAPELLPQIFERFRQADGSSKRQFGGLGLGLTIVKHLTELHGGSVSAHSNGENTGTTFVVELPLAAETILYADLSPFAARTDSPYSPLLAGVKILIVDDDGDALDLLSYILSDKGAIARAANSAKEALNMLTAETFDLLISDLGMAEMDGFDLIAKVRQTFSAKVLPAIALTGYVSAADREKVLESGFQMHLPKPVNIEKLSAAALELVNAQMDAKAYSE